jgi:ATP-dependent exoDNAse (exonuclease V) alpha subunit
VNAIRSGIARIGDEIAEKAWTVGRDEKAERNKRIVWGVLQGSIGAVFTLAARRVGAKAWGVLTGEQPPQRR